MIRKSFSTPWSNLFHFFVCLVPVSMSGIQGGACDDNAPCLGRGGCYFIEDRVSQTLFSTKCVCVKGYSGRWCQFPVDDKSMSLTERINPKVRGGWSFWSSWSNCPYPNPKDNCGNQFRNRERSCTNPTPTFNGEYCEGAGKEYQNCSFVPCAKEVPNKWSEWTAWTKCSKSCGDGTMNRNRICLIPFYRQGSCAGDETEAKSCLKTQCRHRQVNLDHPAYQWSAWTRCSKTCGIGNRYRHRLCPNAEKLCFETERCYETYCRGHMVKVSDKQEKPTIKKILWLPLMIATLSFVLVGSVGMTISIRVCYRKWKKRTKQRKLLKQLLDIKSEDLLDVEQEDLPDIEREPLLGNDRRPPQTNKRPPTRQHRLHQILRKTSKGSFSVKPVNVNEKNELYSTKSRKLSISGQS